MSSSAPLQIVISTSQFKRLRNLVETNQFSADGQMSVLIENGCSPGSKKFSRQVAKPTLLRISRHARS